VKGVTIHATMSFSDSDWTHDPPRRAPLPLPPAQARALVLAVTIALSCVALALAVYGVEQWLDASARAEALRGGGRATASIPDPAVLSPPAAAMPPALPPTALPPTATGPATAAAASAPRAEEPIDPQQLAALEAEMKQRAREAAEQAAAEAVRRKERLWERWYQRPAFCNENPTAAQMVECANLYIRARKAFEERYAAGRL
jgi:hypothetical protein